MWLLQNNSSTGNRNEIFYSHVGADKWGESKVFYSIDAYFSVIEIWKWDAIAISRK